MQGKPIQIGWFNRADIVRVPQKAWPTFVAESAKGRGRAGKEVAKASTYSARMTGISSAQLLTGFELVWSHCGGRFGSELCARDAPIPGVPVLERRRALADKASRDSKHLIPSLYGGVL